MYDIVNAKFSLVTLEKLMVYLPYAQNIRLKKFPDSDRGLVMMTISRICLMPEHQEALICIDVSYRKRIDFTERPPEL